MKKYIVAGVVALIALFAAFSYFNTIESANRHEEVINRLDRESEAKLSEFTLSIMEASKVPEKYRDDLQGIIKETLKGRYGENGNQMVRGFLSEQNIKLNETMYLNLQNAIFAGRKEFRLTQNKVLDACEEYKVMLRSPFDGWILKGKGYPHLDLTNKCEIVSDDKSAEAFKSKRQTPVLK